MVFNVFIKNLSDVLIVTIEEMITKLAQQLYKWAEELTRMVKGNNANLRN